MKTVNLKNTRNFFRLFEHHFHYRTISYKPWSKIVLFENRNLLRFCSGNYLLARTLILKNLPTLLILGVPYTLFKWQLSDSTDFICQRIFQYPYKLVLAVIWKQTITKETKYCKLFFLFSNLNIDYLII